MIIQFITHDPEYNNVYSNVVARIKITKQNKYMLDTLKDGSYVDVLGVTYKIMHTLTVTPIKNTRIKVPIYNVYISNSWKNFNNFYPTSYLPNDETIKECKDYFVRDYRY